MTATVAAHAREVDRRRYVSPPELERVFARLLDPHGEDRVVAVLGPGGAGKSAALRDAARRAEARGYRIAAIDCRGRGLPDLAEELAGHAVTDAPLLVALDEVGALGGAVHGLGPLLAGLPAGSRAVLAARLLPAGWLPVELEPVTRQVTLAALGDAAADELLARYGVDDPEARRRITSWSHGLPLALTLAAHGWATAPDRLTAVLAATSDDVAEHLTDGALAQLDGDVLTLTAIADGVDAELLAAVLPEHPPAEALDALAACSFVETREGRLALHPLLAESLTRRAIADGRYPRLAVRAGVHMIELADAGDVAAMERLARLVLDPELRGSVVRATPRLFSDRPREAELAELERQVESRMPGSWPLIGPWLAAPHGVAHVVRRSSGAAAGAAAVLPLAAADGIPADHRALVAPMAEWARVQGLPESTTMLTAFLVAFGPPESAAWGVANSATARRHRASNPRFNLVNQIGPLDYAEPMAALRFQEVPELARTLDGIAVRTWIADGGEDGLCGYFLDAVAREAGVPLALPGDVLVAALDAFHDDDAWGRLPLGDDPVLARMRVRRAVGVRLAARPELLRLVRERYLTPGASHEGVARAAFLSRSTYFRRLQEARATLADR